MQLHLMHASIHSFPTVNSIIIPGVCINYFSMRINVDFPWNTRNLFLCVFGQQLKAQSTSANKNTAEKAFISCACKSKELKLPELQTKTTNSNLIEKIDPKTP